MDKFERIKISSSKKSNIRKKDGTGFSLRFSQIKIPSISFENLVTKGKGAIIFLKNLSFKKKKNLQFKDVDFIEFKDDKDLSLVNDVLDVKDENLQDAKIPKNIKYQISKIKNIKLGKFKTTFILTAIVLLILFFAIFLINRRINILLIGTDEVDEYAKRSDTLILITYKPFVRKVGVLSIPRDTLVNFSENKIVKINSIFAYGYTHGKVKLAGKLITKKVSEMIGLKVKNYIYLDYTGVAKIIDAIGGIEINVPKRMYYVDRAAKLKIDLVPGYQKLNGEEALEYLRFRHDAKGDIGRVERQQEFIMAFVKRAKQPVILSKIPKLVKELSNYVHTNLGIHNIIILAKKAKDIKINDIAMSTLPGEPVTIKGLYYWKCDNNKIKETLKNIMHGSDDVVEIDKAKVETEGNGVTIKVEVLNGCGKEGIGIEVTRKLRDKGFDVINCENAPGFNYEHTLIFDRSGDSEKASKVGKTLGVKRKNIKSNVNESALVDVTVVVGKDYKNDPKGHPER